MLQIIFDVATIVLLLGCSAATLVFHQRISRLRDAIAEAGQVLPKLDAAVSRMNDAASGFSGRIQAEMETVEGRVNGAKRLASELAGSARDAEDLVTKLETQLRQAKRLDTARARAVPRELAEPKGFAEHVEKLSSQAPLSNQVPAAPVFAAPVSAATPAPALEDPQTAADRIADLATAAAEPMGGVSRFARKTAAPLVLEDSSEAPVAPRRERLSLLSVGAFNSFASAHA